LASVETPIGKITGAGLLTTVLIYRDPSREYRVLISNGVMIELIVFTSPTFSGLAFFSVLRPWRVETLFWNSRALRASFERP
jgi:hypothetical protein